ncbi:pilus assembly protein [Caproiciproducens galactitolivorans]|uniref:TadE-like protein n=1 Tax=Caproiciproducens galactitolivorans TaxID=642589 RepID=A0A4Z0YIG0_9FIRM|nr:TadE/TadG family type IV pilus assembly protein [Caproiciproducens galactitolivorans]QEY35675.1 pilus assembly protein [Caproiciproducens galactitolivorans]TGJ77406.1 TadE-like protein [Caproiciproducens galactitolivorans]
MGGFLGRKDEKGQSLVEFALVLPFFLLICFGIIDFSWIMHQSITFNHAARQAEWGVTITDRSEDYPVSVYGREAASLIVGKMLEDSTLKKSNLTISNPSVDIRTQYQQYYLPAANGGTRRSLRKWRLITVKADVNYEVPLLTPVAKTLFNGNLTLHKSINKERVLTFKDRNT